MGSDEGLVPSPEPTAPQQNQETSSTDSVSDSHPDQLVDGRKPWDPPKSKYAPEYVGQQNAEGWYSFWLFVGSLLILLVALLGGAKWLAGKFGCDADIVVSCFLLGGSGLLGGTVFATKWLYHAIANGLWHEDRKLWRYLTPWMSLGTTVGIGALVGAGFFKSVSAQEVPGKCVLIGGGFLIGYSSDRFLAKMIEVSEVLFGGNPRFKKHPRPKSKP